MSDFIGPIHYWLFEKILVAERRQQYLFEKVTEMCGTTAEELRDQVRQTYGEPLPDLDLSELIVHDNIHGWLQRQINLSESREAGFIKELIDTCGVAAEELMTRSFFAHGQETGAAAAKSGHYEMSSADGVLKALNDYYLSGMPCDAGDNVISLHLTNWKRTGVDEGAMRKFYELWLKGFVEGTNSCFTYSAEGDRHHINLR